MHVGVPLQGFAGLGFRVWASRDYTGLVRNWRNSSTALSGFRVIVRARRIRNAEILMEMEHGM